MHLIITLHLNYLFNNNMIRRLSFKRIIIRIKSRYFSKLLFILIFIFIVQQNLHSNCRTQIQIQAITTTNYVIEITYY